MPWKLTGPAMALLLAVSPALASLPYAPTNGPASLAPADGSDDAERPELDFRIERIGFPASIWDAEPDAVAFSDPLVRAAQNTRPSAPTSSRFTRSRGNRPVFSTASLRTGGPRGAAMVGLASVPYMIGDTGAGTCLSFGTIGYLEADISHPTLTCSRLNIAENNRAACSDRMYFSYRHFHNASPGRFFQFGQNLNVDRYTLGLEKTFADGVCSIEVRTPLEQRITSNMLTRAYDVNPSDAFIDEDTAQLLGGRELELANMSFIFKMMLAEHEGFLLSAGLGVTAPTAQDVTYDVDVRQVPIYYTDLVPPFVLYSDYQTQTHFTNETWYLSPFLAWSNKASKSRFFQQGFLQVELPTNPTRVRYTDFGSAGVVTSDFNFPPGFFDFGVGWTIDGTFGGSALLDLHAQPLMRLNTGIGYFLINESDKHGFFDQLIAMMELHYTTTLQAAKLTRIPLEVAFVGLDTFDVYPQDAFDPIIGNLNSRVDILNGVLGMTAKVGDTYVTNGFTMPLRSGDNRGFDFEYNLQIQRQF